MRLGFIGAGAIARRHIEALLGDGIEIAVVCDVDEARASDLASFAGAKASTSWQATLDADELDAVFVCTPPTHHVDPAVASLERGIAVYLEKPLARGLEDGRKIVDAWQRSGAVCAVGYQWRSLDILPMLREQIGDDVPGMLVSRSYGPTEPGRSDTLIAGADPAGSWFVDPKRSGGILFELGSHDIDLQCALAGPVVSVQAASATGHLALAGAATTGLDDAVAVTMRFASGALGSVLLAWTDAQKPPIYTLDVLGTELALHLQLDPAFRLEGQARGTTVSAVGRRPPHRTTLDRFLEAVASGDRSLVPCSPADAFRTLATAIASEQALVSGSVVGVGLIDA